ncbi:tyrosinase family protein [Mesorhizobium sp. M0019]|uniref:tyrosinase family protein n=1 Tax=Mesorhizobium sp. M0019 TaxID=2956845 RepID=UPI0033381E60
MPIVHALDCPYGNWWLLPWHCAYITSFEAICRELSGHANLTLPCWDWTTDPAVPGVMFEGVLNPNDSSYLETAALFRAAFEPIVKATNWWAIRCGWHARCGKPLLSVAVTGRRRQPPALG